MEEEISRIFQGCFVINGVSRVFQENFPGVSKKFHVHGTHRSFPSRRRACFFKKSFRKLWVNSENSSISAPDAGEGPQNILYDDD